MELKRKAIELDLSNASLEALDLMLEDGDKELFTEVLESNKTRTEVLTLIYDHPDSPDDIRAEVAKGLQMPVKTSREISEVKQKATEARQKEGRKEGLATRISRLGISEKIKMALKGSRELRNVLLKDSNKMVMMSVLANPKISETEIELLSRSRSVHDDALRAIAKNREWTKNYAIISGLVGNPKTPIGISMKFMAYIKIKDLQLLAKNKNVPENVRSHAKRLISQKKKV